jgi:hypothetical protein
VHKLLALINTPLKRNAVREIHRRSRPAVVPKGQSTVAQRFSVGVSGPLKLSPEGTIEDSPVPGSISRPFGTWRFLRLNPAPKRWAIISLSLQDTEFVEFPKGITLKRGVARRPESRNGFNGFHAVRQTVETVSGGSPPGHTLLKQGKSCRPPGVHWHERSGLAVVLGCFILAARAAAQGILPPPPTDFYGVPPTLETTGTNQPGRMPVPPVTAVPEQPLLQWGPVIFQPHLLYRLMYGDGVPAAPGQNFKTYINQIYPGILMRIGDHWTLDYTPTLSYYSSSQFRNTLDQAVTLTGGTQAGDWTLGLSQGYITSSQPLIETGGQTDTETYPTALSAIYQASSAVSVQLGANQDFRFVGQAPAGQFLTDSKSWSTMDWVNYQFSPKLGAAIGAGFGYDEVSVGSDMTHEDLQARFNWRPGDKLTLSVSGGAEYRQYLTGDIPNSLNPIYGVSVLYQLFEPTTLSLAVSRTYTPSYNLNQLSDATSITASLRQRLLGKLFLDASGGYFKTRYTDTTVALPVTRDDHGTFVTVRLSAVVLKRGTVAAFYSRTENSSNEPGFSVSSSQVGLELGYRF